MSNACYLRHALLFGVFLSGGAVACAPLVVTPPGFVALEERETDYDFRAVSSDGLVIGVREIELGTGGSLAFWTDALTRQLRETQGYALLDTQQVTTQRGLAGTQLRFGHDQDSDSYLYVVTLLVHGDALYLVEMGGQKELVTARMAEFTATVRSLNAG